MTQNRRIVLNIVATYVSPEGVARVAKRALCGVRSLYALVDRLVLWTVGADGAWSDGLRPDGLAAVKMVKYTAK